MPIMSVEGSGEVYLAENAYHVDVIHLEPGEFNKCRKWITY